MHSQILNNPSLVGTKEFQVEYLKVLRSGSQRLGEFLNSAFSSEKPALSITLGSGLGFLVEELTDAQQINFEDLGLPSPGVEGHSGRFVAGKLDGHPVLLQDGRLHVYKGYTGPLAALPTRMQLNAGVETMVLTNAAGYLDPSLSVGQIALLSGTEFDLKGPLHPSTGLYDGEMIGDMFYAMAHGYSKELREKLYQCAQNLGLEDSVHREGVYVYRFGPNYEEASDIWDLYQKRLQRLKEGRPDLAPIAVGMSLVPEILSVAQNNAMRVRTGQPPVQCVAISNFTNPGFGLTDNIPDHEEVQRESTKGGKKIIKILVEYLRESL